MADLGNDLKMRIFHVASISENIRAAWARRHAARAKSTATGVPKEYWDGYCDGYAAAMTKPLMTGYQPYPRIDAGEPVPPGEE